MYSTMVKRERMKERLRAVERAIDALTAQRAEILGWLQRRRREAAQAVVVRDQVRSTGLYVSTLDAFADCVRRTLVEEGMPRDLCGVIDAYVRYW
jgi:hypothetical protein